MPPFLMADKSVRTPELGDHSAFRLNGFGADGGLAGGAVIAAVRMVSTREQACPMPVLSGSRNGTDKVWPSSAPTAPTLDLQPWPGDAVAATRDCRH